MERSRLALLTLITLIPVATIDPMGHKEVTITETGEVAVFEWYQQSIMDKSHAANFCESHGSNVPGIGELRYFFKSLSLQDNSVFYLNDVIETTLDSPNEAIGERMCITIKYSPRIPLQLGETSAIKSCSTEVDASVCRRTTSVTNSTLYMKCLEVYFKGIEDEALIKLDKTSFYIILGTICLVILVTNCLWIIFCYKYCSMQRRTLNCDRTKSSALFVGSEILKPIGLSLSGSDLGRYDLLPDVPLQRGESYRRSRRSSGRCKIRANNPEDKTDAIPGDSGADHKTEADATGFL
ncbi:Plasma membrane channel protein Ist2 [Echinococcus multilocularis]|uniref:Plasma membrane channel protein Ist2 n=1 Tax=Echinococcus multilocularis TaxID=6211 RepID=A0A068Y993_ECHMU|nr:Plasma membrane channel protein Ist2 [Echinococcus multilocularis]